MTDFDSATDRFTARLRRFAAPGFAVLLLVAASLVVTGCSSEGRAENGKATRTSDQTTDEATSSEAKTDKKDKKGAKANDRTTVAVPVSVTPVERGTVSAYLSATANLVAENQVKILAETEGRVERLLVDEGRFVDKGQLLAELANADAEIAFAKAKVKETNARMAHERGEDLIAKELLAREEMDRLAMDYEIAKQELAETQWRLDKTEIRAPFSGQISERMIQIGKHIRPGDELFQITDLEPLIARLYFPETDVVGLAEGREVRIKLNADPDVTFPGRIRHVSDVVDTSTGTVKVTVEAPGAPRGVRPGSFVTVDIVRESRTDVAKVPKDAIIRELRSAHVFVAEDDVAVKRDLELGLEEGRWIEVVAGVEPGEQVIVLGQGGLKNGSTIEVLDTTGQRTAAPRES